ncbi:MAG: type IV pilin N-terminal domain-containing protein [Thermoplasmata archaeon]
MGSRARPAGRWGRTRTSRRAVAEVVGTILILALTVVLFSSIFFFVNTFPRPPSQPSNQFVASLTYGTAGSHGVPITGVRVLHLSGPDVFSAGSQIYLYTQSPYKSICPFSGCSIAYGISGHPPVWALGQTWNATLNFTVYAPTNVSVSVVSDNQLLYNQNVPGTAINAPPIFLRVWASPSPLTHNQSFTVHASIQDPNLITTCISGCVSLFAAGLPGHNSTGIIPMTYSAAPNNYWSGTVPAYSATTQKTWYTYPGGTYVLYVVATNGLNLQNSAELTLSFA